MIKRQEDLLQLRSYIHEMDKEVTMLLQSLQWDRKHLEGVTMAVCKHNQNHRVPLDKKEVHEQDCFLKSLGYTMEDVLLPAPLDPRSATVVQLDSKQIAEIINKEAKSDPLFEKGTGCKGPEPLTVEHLQTAYTADERKVIYDAVINMVPAQANMADLTLPSSSGHVAGSSGKSHQEFLAELRDMKRRRTKYRVAAKTKNYSDVLRDVINSQMELLSEVYEQKIKTERHTKLNDKLKQISKQNSNEICTGDICEFGKKITAKSESNDGEKPREIYKEDKHKEKRWRSKDKYTTECGNEKRDGDECSSNKSSVIKSRSDKYYKSQVNYDSGYSYKRENNSENYSRKTDNLSDSYSRIRDKDSYSRKKYIDGDSYSRKRDNENDRYKMKKDKNSDSYSRKRDSNDSNSRKRHYDERFKDKYHEEGTDSSCGRFNGLQHKIYYDKKIHLAKREGNIN